MKLNDKVYDVLKWLCIILVPALAVFYSSLAQTWGWPYAEQISETLNAVQLFIGALVGISSASYYAEIVSAAEESVDEEGELPVVIEEE